MSKLTGPLSTLLRDTTPSPAEVERLWAEQRTRREPRRRLIWLALPAAALVLAVLLLRGPAGGAPDRPLRLAGGQPLAALDADAPRTVTFEDGSRIEMEAGASLQPLALEGGEVDLLLRRGGARFRVAGTGRRWSLDAGGVLVQTARARFAVYRGPDGVQVMVAEGEVVLRGERVPGRVRRLGPGASLRIGDGVTAPAPGSADTPAAGGAAPAPQTSAGAAGAQPPGASDRDAGPQTTVRREHDPQAAATRGTDTVQAAGHGPAAAQVPAPARTGAVHPPGPGRRAAVEDEAASAQSAAAPPPKIQPPLAAASPQVEPLAAAQAATAGAHAATAKPDVLEDLLRRADAARLAGRPRDALSLLDRMVADFASDRRAGLLAFTRGRILADELHDPKAAALDFARALALGLPAALRETAYLRLIEARKGAGDLTGARSAAQEYGRHFPGGREATRIQRLVETP